MSIFTNLISAWLFNETDGNAIDSFGNNNLTSSLSAPTSTSGTSRLFTPASSQYFTHIDNNDLSLGGDIDFEFAIRVYRTGNSNGFPTVFSKDDVGGNREYSLYFNVASNFWTFECNNGGGIVNANNADGTTLNTWYTIFVGRNATTDKIFIQVDNGFRSENDCTSTLDGSAIFTVGAHAQGTTHYWEGNIDSIYFWKGGRPDSNIENIIMSGGGLINSTKGIFPKQFFSQKYFASKYWSPIILGSAAPVVLTAYTLDAQASSYISIAQNANVLKGLSLTANQGIYTELGQNVDTLKGSVIAANQSNYILVAQDATLEKSIILSCESSNFTLTAQNANTLKGYGLVANQSQYITIFQNVDLEYGKSLIALQGNFTDIHQNANILTTRFVTANQNDYLLNFQTANFPKGSLVSCLQSSYLLNTQNAGLLKGYNIFSNQGLLTINGQNVNLLITRLIGGSAASYILNLQDVGLVNINSKSLVSSNGNFTLLGQDIYLLKQYLNTALNGSYTFTSLDLNLFSAKKIIANNTSLTFTGNSLGLLYNKSVFCNSNSYTAIGQNANLLANRNVQVLKGDFTVDGAPATLILIHGITALAGAIIITANTVGLFKTSYINVDTNELILEGNSVDLTYFAIELLDGISGVDSQLWCNIKRILDNIKAPGRINLATKLKTNTSATLIKGQRLTTKGKSIKTNIDS